jgi:hypothetical protein
VPDRLALPIARRTHALHLLEDAWRELHLLDAHAVPVARAARVDGAVLAAGALARRTDGLLLNGKVLFGAGVKVAQGQRDAGLFVRAALFAALVAKVAGAAEEAGEEIKGVVVLPRAAALFVLVYAFVAVLVVDAASFCIGEDVVGFGDTDKSVVGGVVASVGGQLEYSRQAYT